ncbi:MAG TPA: hypothetical protein PKO09_01100 [Anaerolineae bacterium]|nr:hypothetical protein [Anaerolineae bacterium]
MEPSATNPYKPGQPVVEPALFFGRGDLLASVREQLVRDRRVVIVGGARQIGKTSFLRRLASELPEGFAPVMVSLAGGSTRGSGWLEWRLAQAVVQAISAQFSLSVCEPTWESYEDRPDRFLAECWPQVRAALGRRTAVLLLDDVDALQGGSDDLLEGLSALLARWRRQGGRLAVVLSAASEALHALESEYPVLFAGAHAVTLGPLPNDDAVRLITQPVEGRLTFDHGVPRRLVELTSGHPYYLHLVCSALFDRCAGEGWVNQHDVDLVVRGLAGQEIARFRESWSESDAQEQAVIGALASLRGARGVATAHEVQGLLSRSGVRVTQAQVEAVLGRLAAREIVERLGALSYRFGVALFREWLAGQVDLRAAMAGARWEASGRGGREGARRAAKPSPGRVRLAPQRAGQGIGGSSESREGQSAQPGSEAGPTTAEHHRGRAPGRRRAWFLVAGLLCATLILSAAWALRRPTSQPIAVPTVRTKAPAVGLTFVPSAVAAVQASVAPSPVPTLTSKPAPTAPVVTSRSLPAIAYLSKPKEGGLWTIYLMGSDGSNRIPITEASSDFVSAPSWSPGGDRLAFVSDRDGSADIWVADREGREAVNLTRDSSKDNCPAWSPDGQWIAFASVRDSPYWELYVMQADGSELRRLTWWEGASDLWPSWSPDGRRLAFASKRDGNWEIYSAAADGTDLIRLTYDPADDQHPSWSPDGRWIGFDSLRGGYADVYVVPAEGGDVRNVSRLSSASDLGPTWSPDGSRIAFCSDRNGDWDIFSAALDGSALVQLTTADTVDQLPAWRP